MNILFISSLDDIQSTAHPLQTQQQIQFGISYLSSFLKKHGHSTRLMVLSKISGQKNFALLEKYCKEFSPGLICFTAVATEFSFIATIAQHVKKKYRSAYLLIGGPHASLNPQEVLSHGFDAACIGEGEDPVLELVVQLERREVPSGISNLWIKRENGIERNPTRPLFQDLDSLPFPDRQMWQEWIEEKDGSRSSVLLGRGCPFQCAYCCNHAFRRLAEGTYVRHRSPHNIIQEIKGIVAQFPGTKEVYLEVEAISLNKSWALELALALESFNKQRIQPLSFGSNIRITPHCVLDEIFAAFKRCNFRYVNIGLESGSERVRRDILRREYSNEDIVNATHAARKHGLQVGFYNIIGIPGETFADFKETVALNRLCAPDWHLTSIFFPYPGTDLYSLCKKQGLITEHLDGSMERKKAILNLRGFSRQKIQKSYILFDYYVYRGIKPMHKIVSRVFRSLLETNCHLNHLYRRLTCIPVFKRLKNVLKVY